MSRVSFPMTGLSFRTTILTVVTKNKSSHFAMKTFVNEFNPDYALEILLRAKIPAKYEASQLFLFHRNSGYASFVKVHIL